MFLNKKKRLCVYILCSIFVLVNISDYYDICSIVKYYEIKIEIRLNYFILDIIIVMGDVNF